MTQSLGEWLEERAEGVPAELLERIRAVIESVGDAAALEKSVRELSRAVATHLDQTRDRAYVERRDALDLLTADALVTYVLELAASLDPGGLDTTASELMRLVVGPKRRQAPPVS